MATRRKLNEQGEIRFYEWLEERIAEAGTRKAFAEKTGVHENNLSTLRKGSKAPTERMVEKLAAAYDLSVRDVVGYNGVADEGMKPRGDRTGTKRKPKKEQPQIPQALAEPKEDKVPFSFINAWIEDNRQRIEELKGDIETATLLLEEKKKEITTLEWLKREWIDHDRDI